MSSVLAAYNSRCRRYCADILIAPAGKAYELWYIPKAKGASPARAGMFQSQSDGTVMQMIPGPIDANTTAAIAVTLENEAGVDAPTSTPVIVATLAPALQ